MSADSESAIFCQLRTAQHIPFRSHQHSVNGYVDILESSTRSVCVAFCQDEGLTLYSVILQHGDAKLTCCIWPRKTCTACLFLTQRFICH